MTVNVIEKEKLGLQNGYFLRRVEALGLGLATTILGKTLTTDQD